MPRGFAVVLLSGVVELCDYAEEGHLFLKNMKVSIYITHTFNILQEQQLHHNTTAILRGSYNSW
jgi:hypothetical protein